jgi:hypothetical protein
LKNNESKKIWGHRSSGTESAKQVQSPEFKPHTAKSKKKKPNQNKTKNLLSFGFIITVLSLCSLVQYKFIIQIY